MAISYTLLPRGVNRVSAGSSVSHESKYVPSEHASTNVMQMRKICLSCGIFFSPNL